MNRPVLLESVHALVGAIPKIDIPDGKRCIGVDHLTGIVLEARVAIEACRS